MNLLIELKLNLADFFISLSEAYNAPAPTIGNYPLRPKHSRPPKASSLGAKMHLPVDDDVSGNSHHDIFQLTTGRSPAQIPEESSDGADDLSFTLDQSDDCSTSDILAFLESFKVARDASVDIQAATALALEHRPIRLVIEYDVRVERA